MSITGKCVRTLVSAACIFAALAISLPAGAADDAAKSSDWPQFLGANQDGVSTEKFQTTWPEDGPKKLWTAPVGAGYSTVSTWKNQVFTMGNDKDTDTVWCLDADTGKEVWKHTYKCMAAGGGYPGPRCTPTVDGEFVYTLSQDGQLFCLDIKTGTPKWSKNVVKDFGAKIPQWGLSGSPALMGDMIVLDLGEIVAVKKATGEKAWASTSHPVGYSTPKIVTGDKAMIAAFPADGLVVLGADGKEISKYAWKTSYDVNATTPIVSDGKVYITSGYGTGGALVEAATGKEIWKNKELACQGGTPALYEGCLYALTGNYGTAGQVKCVDFKTGKVKWSQKGFTVGALTLSGGKLIVVDAKGTVTIANASPDGYKELAKAEVAEGQTWTAPVLAGGRLYVRTNGKPGQLVCLDVRETK
jgi:outer membrane protein assembly factor BamB